MASSKKESKPYNLYTLDSIDESILKERIRHIISSNEEGLYGMTCPRLLTLLQEDLLSQKGMILMSQDDGTPMPFKEFVRKVDESSLKCLYLALEKFTDIVDISDGMCRSRRTDSKIMGKKNVKEREGSEQGKRSRRTRRARGKYSKNFEDEEMTIRIGFDMDESMHKNIQEFENIVQKDVSDVDDKLNEKPPDMTGYFRGSQYRFISSKIEEPNSDFSDVKTHDNTNQPGSKFEEFNLKNEEFNFQEKPPMRSIIAHQLTGVLSWIGIGGCWGRIRCDDSRMSDVNVQISLLHGIMDIGSKVIFDLSIRPNGLEAINISSPEMKTDSSNIKELPGKNMENFTSMPPPTMKTNKFATHEQNFGKNFNQKGFDQKKYYSKRQEQRQTQMKPDFNNRPYGDKKFNNPDMHYVGKSNYRSQNNQSSMKNDTYRQTTDYEMQKAKNRETTNNRESAKQQGLFCTLCNTSCMNERFWSDHINGKKHQLNVLKNMTNYCQICNMNYTGEDNFCEHLRARFALGFNPSKPPPL